MLNAVGEAPTEPDTEQFRIGDEDWYLREREKPDRFVIATGATGVSPVLAEPEAEANPARETGFTSFAKSELCNSLVARR